MPSYPCNKCKKPVDLHDDKACPSCKNSTPFSCSKCGKSISGVHVFNAKKVTIKKPLFCEACGYESEVVECKVCKKGLLRSQGIEPNPAKDHVYHEECLAKQEKTAKYMATAGLVLAPIIGLTAFLTSPSNLIGGIMFIVSAALSVLLTAMLSRKLQP